ncbi:MAG: hypothetical protein AAB859_01770, partial [Patescibacteria group bacterium]
QIIKSFLTKYDILFCGCYIGNFILGFSCCWLATFIPFGLMMLKMHLDEGKIKEWNSWHQGGGDHLGPNH